MSSQEHQCRWKREEGQHQPRCQRDGEAVRNGQRGGEVIWKLAHVYCTGLESSWELVKKADFWVLWRDPDSETC